MNSPRQNSSQRRSVLGIALIVTSVVVAAFVFFLNSGDGLSGPDRRLFEAIEEGDPTAAQAALTAGADPNAKTSVRTPLFLATAEGHLDIVELLLQQPDIEVNKSAYGGFTAMDAALQCKVHVEGEARSVKIAQPAIAKRLRADGARTFSEKKDNAPSEPWINNWPKSTFTGTVVATNEDHIEVEDDQQVRRPVMGKTIQQVKLNDRVVVTGYSYPFAPIEKSDTVWAKSIEKSE